MTKIPIQFDTEKLRLSLQALSRQQGHQGTIEVDDVVTIVELREDRIRSLLQQLSDADEIIKDRLND